MVAAPNASTIPDDVTICITSCARLDLLERTLTSFKHFNTGGAFVLSEDSADEAVIAEIRVKFSDIKVLHDESRVGLMKSIDRLYSTIQTKYIFHLEDDWISDGPVDWEAAKAMLSSGRNIANVCVRRFDEIKEKYRVRSDSQMLDGREFRVMHKDAHPEWFAWSPNPGLIETALYHRYAPFSRVLADQMSAVMKADGLVQAWLLPGVARHIGHGRNVTDPTTPPRPRSKILKWVRSIKKRLYYAGLRRTPY
jgi:hypothetical protein